MVVQRLAAVLLAVLVVACAGLEAVDAPAAVGDDTSAEVQPEPAPDPAPGPDSAPDPDPAPAPSGDRWTVTNIVDGDTVDVRQGTTTERVRVIGIDTPERGECGFSRASDALAALVLGEVVLLAPGARVDRDRFGRILRYLDSDAGDAGLLLIEQGLAVARYDSRDGYGRHPRQDAYVAADDLAEHVCGVISPAAAGADGAGSASGGGGQHDTSSGDGGVVKLSTTGICHAPGTTFHARTLNFTAFDDLDACLAAGGRLPRA